MASLLEDDEPLVHLPSIPAAGGAARETKTLGSPASNAGAAGAGGAAVEDGERSFAKSLTTNFDIVRCASR